MGHRCPHAAAGGSGITVRNSTFERCGNTFIGFYTDFGNFTNVLVENNVFRYVADSFWSTQIVINNSGYTCSLVFRYNTYDTTAGDNAPPRFNCPGEQIYGNIFTNGAVGGECVGSWSFNVYEQPGFDCGTGIVANPAYANRSGGDYHLTAGSGAIGKGDPSRFQATDFEGTARSSPPDAGYDER